MSDILRFYEEASSVDELQDIADRLQEVKDAVSNVICDYEADEESEDAAATLSEALDDLESAWDLINEVIEDAP